MGRKRKYLQVCHVLVHTLVLDMEQVTCSIPSHEKKSESTFTLTPVSGSVLLCSVYFLELLVKLICQLISNVAK